MFKGQTGEDLNFDGASCCCEKEKKIKRAYNRNVGEGIHRHGPEMPTVCRWGFPKYLFPSCLAGFSSYPYTCPSKTSLNSQYSRCMDICTQWSFTLFLFFSFIVGFLTDTSQFPVLQMIQAAFQYITGLPTGKHLGFSPKPLNWVNGCESLFCFRQKMIPWHDARVPHSYW